MTDAVAGLHPLAPEHLPHFVTAPGDSDRLMIIMIVFLLGVVFAVGTLYFTLHAYPERRSHKANKVQFEIVAVLGLLSLVTHNHLFWVAALLLAMITIPDLMTPIQDMARALKRLARMPAEEPAAQADAAEPAQISDRPEEKPGHA